MTYTLKLKEERKIGHEAGFREGIEKGKLEDALEMLKNGISMEIVLKCTKLPFTAIKEAAEKVDCKYNNPFVMQHFPDGKGQFEV